MENEEKRIVKQISFSKENLDVWKILNDQKNASQYVCEAVRSFKDKEDSIITVDKDELKSIIKEAFENL